MEGFHGLTRAEIEATLSASEGMADLPREPTEMERRVMAHADSLQRERVAEAIHAADDHGTWEMAGPATRTRYLDRADAAIAAMQNDPRAVADPYLPDDSPVFEMADKANLATRSAAGGGRADDVERAALALREDARRRWGEGHVDDDLDLEEYRTMARVILKAVVGEGERLREALSELADRASAVVVLGEGDGRIEKLSEATVRANRLLDPEGSTSPEDSRPECDCGHAGTPEDKHRNTCALGRWLLVQDAMSTSPEGE